MVPVGAGVLGALAVVLALVAGLSAAAVPGLSARRVDSRTAAARPAAPPAAPSPGAGATTGSAPARAASRPTPAQAAAPAPARVPWTAPAKSHWGPGYRLAAADGGVFSFGNAQYLGSMGARRLSAPVVGLAGTPDGLGYWEASADGGVFAFGSAHYYGGLAGHRLAAAVVGLAATPDGRGYWLASSDGGVFTFGDAAYYGGMAGYGISAPVVGIAATPDGTGYWLVSSDGGVFTYGTARYYGGMAGHRITDPVVGIAATPDGTGYWLVSSDGGVFTYGTARYYGGMGGRALAAPVVGLAPSPTGRGYWLGSSDGGIFTYGDAGYWGAPGGFQLSQPVTAVAAGLVPAHHQAQVEVGGRYGFDISWPQCDDRSLPAAHAFAVLGVTGGKALTVNPCLQSQWAWATAASGASGLYINLNSPDSATQGEAASGPAGRCRPHDPACPAYNYGAATVRAAVAYARRSGAKAPMFWLDVETENHWSAQLDVNALVIKGAIDELHRRGLHAGVYSTSLQWGEITGGARFGVPVWVAGSPDLTSASSYCARGFNGGPVWMVQTMLSYDVNYLCSPAAAAVAFGVHPLPEAPSWPLDRLPVPVHPGLPVPEVAVPAVPLVSSR